MKKKIILVLILAAVTAGLVFFLLRDEAAAPEVQQQKITEQPIQKIPEAPSFDKTKFSIEPSASLWAIVNKKRALPAGYLPADLINPDVQLRLVASDEQMQISSEVEPDLIAMFMAAKKDGVTLVFGSGYRSEKLQKAFYSQYTNESGQAAADTFSARPGHSEHQTGLAFDVTTQSGNCHLEVCFGATPEGKWLAAHAPEYGFVIRYLDGKDAVTGYQYEPWHVRYVGRELAAQIATNKTTLEEFFNLPPAPNY